MRTFCFFLTISLSLLSVIQSQGVENPCRGRTNKTLVKLIHKYQVLRQPTNQPFIATACNQPRELEKIHSQIITLLSLGGDADDRNPPVIPFEPSGGLPLAGMTVEELVTEAHAGNADAAMILAIRHRIRQLSNRAPENAFLWNTFQSAKTWLDQAVALKRPGAEFARAVYLHGDRFDVKAESLPGYDDFVAALRDGDILLAEFFTLTGNETIRKHLISFESNLERLANRGDPTMIKNCLAYSQFSFPVKRQKISFEDPSFWNRDTLNEMLIAKNKVPSENLVSLCRELADQGDPECMNMFLKMINMRFLEEQDTDRIFRYWTKILEAGFPMHQESETAFPMRLVQQEDFPAGLPMFLFSEEERRDLYKELTKAQIKRGNPDLMIESSEFRDFNEAAFVASISRLKNMGEHHPLYRLNPFHRDWEKPGLKKVVMRLLREDAHNGDADACRALARILVNDPTEHTRMSSLLEAQGWAQQAIDIYAPFYEQGFNPFLAAIADAKLLLIKARLRTETDMDAQSSILADALELHALLQQEQSNRLGEACFLLGLMHETGFGTSSDPEQASLFYLEGAWFHNDNCLKKQFPSEME